ncbi:MAG: ribonuclease HIII [Parachlamydiales bacterium]
MATPFVTQIDLALEETLRTALAGRGFSFSQPLHTRFAAKGEGVSLTLYDSGKLVVQGKGAPDFITYFLEPEVLGTFTYGVAAEVDYSARIGSDEAGKGDYFGPLCIAAVYADREKIERLVKMGVIDSKRLPDGKVRQLAKEIGELCPWEIVRLFPTKYNELYQKFGNLNSLLAWAHAAAIGSLQEKTGAKAALVDQFAYPHVLDRALAKRGVTLKVTQRVRAESDPVVAAASILARAAFLKGLDQLSEEWGIPLPKGANNGIVETGCALVAKHGQQVLEKTGKLHFKTTRDILRAC